MPQRTAGSAAVDAPNPTNQDIKEVDGTSTAQSDAAPHGMSMFEFVAFIALLMALNAMAIDIMLPALPDISAGLGVSGGNAQQLIIVAYLLGFGPGQLIYGPLADRFGRKPVLICGLVFFAVASLVATLTTSFMAMLIARAIQGVGAAAPRVIALAIVRDCHSGAAMARVMSMAMMVFMTVPIIAPSVGQLIVLFGPWRWVFAVLAISGLLMLGWSWMRLGETLDPARLRKINPAAIVASYRETITTRQSVGYGVAGALIIGSLFAFIASAQQVFVEFFKVGTLFPIVFAALAIVMSLAAFLNSRFVERYGIRTMSHNALAAFLITAIINVIITAVFGANFWVYAILLSGNLFFFGFIMSNFNTLAMEPLGHIAGTASSMLGFMTTTIGALCGFAVGQAYDGTALPLAIGFAVLAALSLGLVMIIEKGRFAQNPTEDEAWG